MTTLVAGTVHAVASTSQIISGAYNLSRKLLEFLRPWWCARLDPEDAHHLFCIQRQIECLIRPLEFCIIWSRYRDPMSQHTILLVEDTLRRVWNRLHGLQQPPEMALARPAKDAPASSASSGPSLLPEPAQRIPTASGRTPRPCYHATQSPAPQETQSGPDRSRTARKRPEQAIPSSKILRWCVEELQIATAQLNLSLATIQAYRSSSAANAGAPTISVASLLKASRYLWAMQGRTGDICLRVGRLFLWETELPPGNDLLPERPTASAATQCCCCCLEHEGGYWRCVYPHCFFRVVKQAAINVSTAGTRLPAATYIPSILIEAVRASSQAREPQSHRATGQPLDASDAKRRDFSSEHFGQQNLQNRAPDTHSCFRNNGLSTFRDWDNFDNEESTHDFLLVTDHFDGIEAESDDLLNSGTRRAPRISCVPSAVATLPTSPATADKTSSESLLPGSPKSMLPEKLPVAENVEKKTASPAEGVVHCCCSYLQGSEAGSISQAAIPKAIQLPIEMALQMRLYSEGLRDHVRGKRPTHVVKQAAMKWDHATAKDTGQRKNNAAEMTGTTLLSTKDAGPGTSAVSTPKCELQLPLGVSRGAAQSAVPCGSVSDTQGPALIWHMPEETLPSCPIEAELQAMRGETRAGSAAGDASAGGPHQSIRTTYHKYGVFSNRTLAFLFDHDECRAPSSESTIDTTRAGCSPFSRQQIEAHVSRSRVSRAMEVEKCLSPIELLYIARLCFLDAAMLSHGRLKGAPCDRPAAASWLVSLEETAGAGTENYDGGLWSQVSDELLHELLGDCFLS